MGGHAPCRLRLEFDVGLEGGGVVHHRTEDVVIKPIDDFEGQLLDLRRAALDQASNQGWTRRVAALGQRQHGLRVTGKGRLDEGPAFTGP